MRLVALFMNRATSAAQCARSHTLVWPGPFSLRNAIELLQVILLSQCLLVQGLTPFLADDCLHWPFLLSIQVYTKLMPSPGHPGHINFLPRPNPERLGLIPGEADTFTDIISLLAEYEGMSEYCFLFAVFEQVD